jgi:hypothetical protein
VLQETAATAAQHQTSLESINRRLQNLEDALYLRNVPDSRRNQVALQRLLAKPSQMKELCDELLPLTNPPSLPGSQSTRSEQVAILGAKPSYGCSCLRRKRREISSSRFGFLFWRTETTTCHHSPGCRFYNLPTGQTSQSFHLTATPAISILKLGLQVSYALTRSSISHSISTFNVVNINTSPIFRAIRLVCSAVPSSKDRERSNLLVQWGSELATQILRHRKSLPRDVDQYGNSILMLVSSVICLSESENSAVSLSSLMIHLMELGFPADTNNFNGE